MFLRLALCATAVSATLAVRSRSVILPVLRRRGMIHRTRSWPAIISRFRVFHRCRGMVYMRIPARLASRVGPVPARILHRSVIATIVDMRIVRPIIAADPPVVALASARIGWTIV